VALPSQAFVLVILFSFGAILGSFFNVCIYRLPEDKSIVRPRSQCPKCGHPIAWYDNIPILSYIILGAKCRHCRAEISIRYPLVEMLTAVLFAVTGHVLLSRGEPTAVLIVYLAFVGALIVLSFIDLDHMLLPDDITIPGMVLVVVLSGVFPTLQEFPGGGRYAIAVVSNARLNAVANSLIGMAVGAGLIYLTGVLGKLAFRKEAMGFGDVKLMGLMGGLMGTWFVILIYFVGPIFGVVFGVIVLLTKGEHHIPYGPFLSMAAMTMVLWGPQIIEWVYGRFRPVFQLMGAVGP